MQFSYVIFWSLLAHSTQVKSNTPEFTLPLGNFTLESIVTHGIDILVGRQNRNIG